MHRNARAKLVCYNIPGGLGSFASSVVAGAALDGAAGEVARVTSSSGSDGFLSSTIKIPPPMV